MTRIKDTKLEAKCKKIIEDGVKSGLSKQDIVEEYITKTGKSVLDATSCINAYSRMMGIEETQEEKYRLNKKKEHIKTYNLKYNKTKNIYIAELVKFDGSIRQITSDNKMALVKRANNLMIFDLQEMTKNVFLHKIQPIYKAELKRIKTFLNNYELVEKLKEKNIKVSEIDKRLYPLSVSKVVNPKNIHSLITYEGINQEESYDIDQRYANRLLKKLNK